VRGREGNEGKCGKTAGCSFTGSQAVSDEASGKTALEIRLKRI
jgi:hypothetical protein